MEWNTLKRLNEGLKTVDIKGKPYIEVNKRVIAFRELEPNGSISTEIVSFENGVVTMKATVTSASGQVLATGYAQEKETSSYINKTSYIENCETSAVGRALGFCGIGVDSSIASAEEVANAIHQQEQKPSQAKSKAPARQTKPKPSEPKQLTYRDKVMIVGEEKGLTPKQLAEKYGLNKDTTEERFEEVLADLEGRTL
jgi:hypothetical protein